MRLIDADAFREWWLENGANEYIYDTNSILDSIDSWPTLAIDAVPVVRCCDCKHCDIGTNYFESWCYCKAWRHSVNPTDFCSYGERKQAHNG